MFVGFKRRASLQIHKLVSDDPYSSSTYVAELGELI
jgi:hypothetical protein